jgi:hypothetical protein
MERRTEISDGLTSGSATLPKPVFSQASISVTSPHCENKASSCRCEIVNQPETAVSFACFATSDDWPSFNSSLLQASVLIDFTGLQLIRSQHSDRKRASLQSGAYSCRSAGAWSMSKSAPYRPQDLTRLGAWEDHKVSLQVMLSFFTEPVGRYYLEAEIEADERNQELLPCIIDNWPR